MIKPWQERVKKEFHGVTGVTAAYMQSEINELRAKLAEKTESEKKWIALHGAVSDLYERARQKLIDAAAGAAPVQREPVAWRAWNSQHHCYDYGEAGETDALGRVVEYLCLEGEV